MFFILTTWELSVNRIDLQVGPPRANLGAGSPSCTPTQQLTIYTSTVGIQLQALQLLETSS